MARGEIPGFPLIVRRPELIDDGYLPQHLRDPRPMAESLDAPQGFHVANWRSRDAPATDTPEAFLEWLRYTLPQFDSWERPGSMAESLADAGYTPAHLDWAKELHDAYVIVRVLQDHRGYPAFDRDEPAARDLVSARTNLRAIRDWVLTNMPKGTGQDSRAGGAVETSQPQDLQAGPLGKGQDAAAGGDGMGWQDVKAELEALCLKGELYTSQQRLADKIGCKKNLVQKAIAKGPEELQKWASKQRGPSRLNAPPEVSAVAFENTPDGREPDPADIVDPPDAERTLKRLIEEMGKRHGEKAQAQLKAEFAAGHYDAGKLELLAAQWIHDPDEHEQTQRHLKAKPARVN